MQSTTEPSGRLWRADREPRRVPQLRPELLQTYPNPFRERTSVGFHVPSTVGEAFALEDAALLGDPRRELPTRSGQPSVSLKIYNLGGAEVVSLHEGPLSPGSYEAAWDGANRFGHPVASGTYFCKLQVEGWAITKRIVFLR